MLREYACRKGLKTKLVRERLSWLCKVVCRKGDVSDRILKGTGRHKRKVVVHHNRLKTCLQKLPELLAALTTDAAASSAVGLRVE